MKSLILILIFTYWFLPSGKKSTQKLPTVVFDSGIDKRLTLPIRNAINHYFTFYNCPDTVSIHYGKEVCEERVFADSSKSITLAYGKTGEIFLCPIMETLGDSLIFNIVSHELYHTLARDTLFVQPFDIFGGKMKVLGYHGLAVLIKIKDSARIFFRGVEEGAAEICAAGIVSYYQPLSRTYARVGLIFRDLILKKIVTFPELLYFQKNNDFVGFCAKILNRERRFISKNDIETVMKMFSQGF